MPNKSLTIAQVLTLLAETPVRIDALTTGLTPAQLRAAPSRGEWSVNDVLAHLRSCADVWGNCMAVIIAEDKPTFRAVNPTTWINQTDYPRMEFLRSFRSFATQRADLLALLWPLPRKAWSRTAMVTGAGNALARTVLFYGQWLAGHERAHVKHIGRVVSRVRVGKRPSLEI